MENVTSFSGVENSSIEPSFISWEMNSYKAYYEVVRDGELLRYYCAHFIAVFGVISNTIAFVVLGCTRRMRKSVLGILLMTLAVADSLVLIFELVAIVTSAVLEDKQRPAPPLLCMFANYLRYSSSSVSHLLVVCISMNRFMAVVFPFKSRWFSRPKNALLQVICVIFVCFVANIYTVSAQTKDSEICMMLDKKNEIAYIIGVVVFNIIICTLLTSVVVLVLSFWTARVFMQNGRNVDLRRNAEPVWSTTRAERQATILLLSVAFSFVLLRLPQLVVWTPLIMKEYNHTLLSNSTELSLLQGYFYTYTLYLLNYAVNLYLYCVCSSLFRRKLLEVFWCVTCRKSLETEPTGTNQNRTGDRSNAVQLRTELRRFESRKFKGLGSIDEVNFKVRTDVVTELKMLSSSKRNGEVKHSTIVPLRYCN